MIFVTNAQGRATFIGSEWTEYTGQSLEDAVGFGWAKVVHPDDREITSRIVADAIQAQCAFSVRYRMMAFDGRAMWVVAGAVPSFGPPDHTFLGFLGSITQIADALRACLRRFHLGWVVEGVGGHQAGDAGEATRCDVKATGALAV